MIIGMNLVNIHPVSLETVLEKMSQLMVIPENCSRLHELWIEYLKSSISKKKSLDKNYEYLFRNI